MCLNLKQKINKKFKDLNKFSDNTFKLLDYPKNFELGLRHNKYLNYKKLNYTNQVDNIKNYKRPTSNFLKLKNIRNLTHNKLNMKQNNKYYNKLSLRKEIDKFKLRSININNLKNKESYYTYKSLPNPKKLLSNNIEILEKSLNSINTNQNICSKSKIINEYNKILLKNNIKNFKNVLLLTSKNKITKNKYKFYKNNNLSNQSILLSDKKHKKLNTTIYCNNLNLKKKQVYNSLCSPFSNNTQFKNDLQKVNKSVYENYNFFSSYTLNKLNLIKLIIYDIFNKETNKDDLMLVYKYIESIFINENLIEEKFSSFCSNCSKEIIHKNLKTNNKVNITLNKQLNNKKSNCPILNISNNILFDKNKKLINKIKSIKKSKYSNKSFCCEYDCLHTDKNNFIKNSIIKTKIKNININNRNFNNLTKQNSNLKLSLSSKNDRHNNKSNLIKNDKKEINKINTNKNTLTNHNFHLCFFDDCYFCANKENYSYNNQKNIK